MRINKQKIYCKDCDASRFVRITITKKWLDKVKQLAGYNRQYNCRTCGAWLKTEEADGTILKP